LLQAGFLLARWQFTEVALARWRSQRSGFELERRIMSGRRSAASLDSGSAGGADTPGGATRLSSAVA
jgi:hypothetical protein